MQNTTKTKIGTAVTHKKTGKTMYLYDYRSRNDIDVLFDDGTITTNKTYSGFKNGYIKYPKNGKKINIHIAIEIMEQRAKTFEKERDSVRRLNKQNISKHGQKMKIIRYGNATDIDIQFENGVIVHHQTYRNFKAGTVRNPKLHLHEKKIANCGMLMKITEYYDSQNITVTFADGTIVKNKTYQAFKKGAINNPNIDIDINKVKDTRINKTSTKKDGTVMTCIEYFDSNNITVQFPDGTIRKNVYWNAFIKGEVAKEEKKTKTDQKDQKINKTSTTKDGIIITCIEYFNANNITIQFPDGSIRKRVTWFNFINGNIRVPENTKNKSHINETNTNRNGLKMTIIKHDPKENPIIQFEDGYITQNTTYFNFQKGYATHKSLKVVCKGNRKNERTVKGHLYNTTISGIAHNYRNTAHYFCECQICKTREIWNFEQIKNHPCNNQIANKDQHTGTDNI